VITQPLALFAHWRSIAGSNRLSLEKKAPFLLTKPEIRSIMIRLPMGTEKNRADLMPGTLDMLVLKILMSGHLHGYAIAQLILQLSDDLLRVEEGSLYPALQRLELNGWITGEWGLSANNRRARFYKLTPDGRKQLAEESARYRRVTGAVARIMGFA
jgi:transcriptional regulator